MNGTFTQYLIGLPSLTQVERALLDRRDRILNAIAEKEVLPTKELTDELAELNIAIGDVPECGG